MANEKKETKIVSIQDLIKRKEELKNRKLDTYEIDTPIGTIVVKKAPADLVSEAVDMGSDSDAYLITNTVIEPNLKSDELLKEFDCFEPLDIVGKLFSPGESTSIATKILKLSGYGQDVESRLHKEIKN